MKVLPHLLSLFSILLLPSSTNAQTALLKANAHLSLTSSKQEMFLGECAIINYAFCLNQSNTVPVKFYNLENQLSRQWKVFQPENAWLLNSHIVNIKGKLKISGKDSVNYYTIYEGAFCPMSTGEFIIPRLMLDMHARNKKDDTTFYVAPFVTKPVKVKVNPLPVIDRIDSIQMSTSYYMVGDFKIADTVKSNNVTVGKPFEYSVNIHGEGYTFPLMLRLKESKYFDVILTEEKTHDFIWDDTLVAHKKWRFTITPKREGEFDLGQLFEPFYFFNPLNQKVQKLSVSKKINVRKSASKGATIVQENLNGEHEGTSILFIVDISTSMTLSDYRPSRLDYLKIELQKLKEKNYPFEILLFAGSVKEFNNSSIDSISTKLIKTRGTAVGDAVWYSLNYIKKLEPRPFKIALVGDGDNTTGHLAPASAILFANKENRKIYTIGIGTSGTVPMLAGEGISYYENTFSDMDLKRISILTGGKYFYLSAWSGLQDIVDLILKE